MTNMGMQALTQVPQAVLVALVAVVLVTLAMLLVTSLVIFLVAVAEVDAQTSIAALIYATTWKFHWKMQHAGQRLKFAFLSWQNASLVMALGQKQAPRQSHVQPVKVTGKCVCSKVSFLFNKPARPVTATAKWSKIHAQSVMAAVV